MFHGYHLGVFIVIAHKAPISLTSVFKPFYSSYLQGAYFNKQTFQYTWLKSYFFYLLEESIKDQI